jgi:hypothetical protein
MPYLPPLLSHKFGFDLAIALCPMAIRHFIGDGSILQTSDFRLKCSRGHAHGCHVPFHSGANQTSMTSTLPRSSTMPCWTAWISGYRRDKIRICWTYSPIAIAYKLESIVEDTALRLPEETPRCGENRREAHGALSVLHGRLRSARSPETPKREMEKSHRIIWKRSLDVGSHVEQEQ